MKFFIPHADNGKQAEDVLEATVQFAQKTTGWKVTHNGICSIKYHHDGREFTATVGEPEPRTGEEVLLILDSNTYLICTPNRGVIRGMPLLVGKNEVYSVEYFD